MRKMGTTPYLSKLGIAARTENYIETMILSNLSGILHKKGTLFL
jgi:hypothetical protein